MGFITTAGENQIAAKQGAGQTLNITSFVLANIAGLGAEPVNRIEALPAPADIMVTLPVTGSGYVNTNQVVYSLVMDSSLGDYDFNWVGLVDADGVLIAVTHVPLIQKRKTAGTVPGNNLTRNFLIAFSGIQATAAIAVPAATWQIDFNARLLGIDERERLSNYDIYGHESFYGTGWKVSRVGATTTYDVAAGIGYVGGVRIASAITQQVTVAGPPKSIWLDVSLQGDISDVSAVVDFVVDAVAHADYTDANGFNHYVTKIAAIAADGSVTDFRTEADAAVKYATKTGLQSQAYTAFTTAGTSTVFTGSVAPALTVYAAGQRFRIKFHAAITAAATLNMNGLGAKSLKQYDASGNKINAVIAANQLVDVEYDGADFVLLNPTGNGSGVLTKSVAGGANVNLTLVEAANGILNFTGLLTANISVIVPTSPKRDWIVKNDTTGAYSLTVKTAAGTGMPCAQGYNSLVFTDGTNVYDSLTKPTPAQFANDTSFATTEFVQRALGGIGGLANYQAGNAAANPIPASNANKLVSLFDSVLGVTLPPLSSVPAGSAFYFRNSMSAGADIVAYAGDLIYATSTVDITTIKIKLNSSLILVSQGAKWIMLGNDSLQYDSNFQAVLAASGYQKLPSGRIEVHGTFTANATPGAPVAVTFPLGMTNCRNVEITPVSASTAAATAWFDTPTGSGFNGRCSIASLVCHYRAIGD